MRLAALALLLAAAPAAGQDALDAPRTVALELREGGELIGAPTLTMRPGRPAAVSVAGGYSLRLRLERTAQGPYLLRSSLYRPGADNSWALIASPAMTVAEGEQALLTIDRPSGPALTFAVTVR